MPGLLLIVKHRHVKPTWRLRMQWSDKTAGVETQVAVVDQHDDNVQ